METSFPAATFIMRVEGDLVAGATAQPGDLLILDRSRPPQPGSLMVTLDHLNRRLHPDAVKFAALGLNPTWTSRAEYFSQRYTTHWQELPAVTPWRSSATPVTP